MILNFLKDLWWPLFALGTNGELFFLLLILLRPKDSIWVLYGFAVSFFVQFAGLAILLIGGCITLLQTAG